jgi:SAM-dependent methyltransferase
MAKLTFPDGLALPSIIADLSPNDTMFDGSSDHYIHVGMSALNAIEAAMLGAEEPRRILDLPCGFGRVTRILRARYPDAAMTVCDLDRPGVDFAAATFGAQGVYSVPNFRDLQLDGSFDLIWVGSLLTHLPEHQTRQFLDFAARHMGPNSRLIVTSHGEHVVTRLRSNTYGLTDPAARGLIAQYMADGYAYRGYDGDECYGLSLVARAWYEALLEASPLRLEAYYDRGWDGHQDVLVIRSAAIQGEAPTAFEQPGIAMPLAGPEQEARDVAGVTGFDEAWYRHTFPDVVAAIGEGTYASGLAHYLLYGWREGRPPFNPANSYAQRTRPAFDAQQDRNSGRISLIKEVWSANPDEQARKSGWYWMAHPAVRARTNTLASGNPAKDVYNHLMALLVARGLALPLDRSVCIGAGGLEHDLASRGLVWEVDVYDASAAAVAQGEHKTRQLGLFRLHYHLADIEKADLTPNSVDAVFAHSSVQNVERLEALFAAVQRILRPSGVFHLFEYVGPSRFQWTDEQLRLANAFLDSLPDYLRRTPSGELKAALQRPNVENLIAADPTASARSAELLPLLQSHFEVIEIRPLGGALAHLALGGIAQNFDSGSPTDAAYLQRLFDTEDAAMADGSIGTDFAAIILTLKQPTDEASAGRPPQQAGSARPQDGLNTAPELDRLTRRHLGEAALRNLPFLPSDFVLNGEGLRVSGYCGASENITQQMTFFINGQKITDVDYPVEDQELKSRFAEVPGMGLIFQARIQPALLEASRFWRFDAAPGGHYNPANWRRSIHYMDPARERFPFPPPSNMARVIGDTSVPRFAMGGATIFNNAANYLREMGLDWSHFPRILDWGCGAGRLTRYLIGETQCTVTGVDIDEDNIAWCRQTYMGGIFHTVPLRPPTDLPAGHFNLVFGLSVFTHLQEADQFLWLEELQRVTQRGGLLFLSVQGPTQFAYNKFPPHIYRKLQIGGFIDMARDPALDNILSDKAYYRASMHSRPYIVERWGEYFDVLAIVDAIAGLQDFVVLRRR